ncbi:DUF6174 domain-containing protein [Aerosakkonemataceae cyanobacterium BLCC-F50]|uniref:DUF6174 domain-containing protein n=1 Tax=Floridaenema flaviceps BLCC-F50 TaxID=3153642 RepID=A0ABV4XY78_9CYAN
MLSKSIKKLFWLITSLLVILNVDSAYASNSQESRLTTGLCSSTGTLLMAQSNLPVLAERNLLALASSNSEELRKNQELWAKQKLRNYRYTLRVSCFCPTDLTQPVNINVRSGRTASITPETSRNRVNREFFQKYDSIDKLFEIIRSAIAQNAYKVDVKYHPSLGYPTQITIDYNKQMADEELFLTINSLEAQSNRRFSQP